MVKTPCVICDIDGTLANGLPRQHELPNWKKFFDRMGDDTVIKPVAKLVKLIQYSTEFFGKVLFVSGRPEEYREITLHWLRQEVDGELDSSDLLMRPTGDYRQDAVVKKEILDKIRETYEPFLAIDDREQVVKMWRENGVFCLACPDQTVKKDLRVFQPEKGEVLLTLMVGPSGGGKSTYARKTYHHASILESDQFRAEIFGNFRDQSKNNVVFGALHDVASVRLKHGLPVVIDATHLRRKDRLASVELAPSGSTVRYVVVDRPLTEKFQSKDWRPESLLIKHHNDFRSQLSEILEGDYLPNVFVEPNIAGGI